MPRHTHTSKGLTIHQSTGRHTFLQQRQTNVKDSRPTGNEKGHMNHQGANDLQRITLVGSPTGGTFDIDFDASGVPATVDFDETAADLQTKLEALSTIAVGDVSVTGEDGGPWVIEFKGLLAYQEQPVITIEDNSLTGKEPEYVIAIEHVRPGRAGQISPTLMPGDLTGGLTVLNTNLDSDEAPSPVPTRFILDSGVVSVPQAPAGSEENTRKYATKVFSSRIPFTL